MLSGFVFGISIMTKLFGVIAAGTLVLLMFAERTSAVEGVGRHFKRFLPGRTPFRPRIREIAVFSLSVALSTLLIMSLFGIGNVVQGAFLNQLHRPVDPVGVKLGIMGVFLLCNIVAIPFAIIGFRRLYRREEGIFVLVGASYLLFFIFQGKTWPHHLIFLSPIIALSACIGALKVLEHLVGRGRIVRRSNPGRTTRIALGSLLLMAIMLNGAFALMINQEGQPLDQSSASIVESLTVPDDYVISGDPMIARLADRPIPPSIVNLAFVQYPLITDDQLNRTAVEYGVTVIVITYRLLHMPGFREFVEGNYTLRAKLYDTSDSLNEDYEVRLIYYLPKDAPLRSDPDWGSALRTDGGPG
jgi:hypothetical protein